MCIRNIFKNWKESMDLHKKVHHYVNILQQLEYLSYRDLDPSEENQRKAHADYFKRKLEEVESELKGKQ